MYGGNNGGHYAHPHYNGGGMSNGYPQQQSDDAPPPPPSGPPPPLNHQKSKSKHHKSKKGHKQKKSKQPPNQPLPQQPSNGFGSPRNNQTQQANMQQQHQHQQQQSYVQPNYNQWASSFQGNNYGGGSVSNFNAAQNSQSLQPNPAHYLQHARSTGNLNQNMNGYANGYANTNNAHHQHPPHQHQHQHQHHAQTMTNPMGFNPNSHSNHSNNSNTNGNNNNGNGYHNGSGNNLQNYNSYSGGPTSPNNKPVNSTTAQPIVNSYTQMSNPAAAYQQMQAANSAYGSMYGSNMNMAAVMNSGSGRNLNMAMQAQPNGAYNKALPQNPNASYGIQQPSRDFVQAYGPFGYPTTGFYYNQSPQYYPNQPTGGGDSIVPPPPMVQAENGEMVPANKKKEKKKKKKHKHSKDKNEDPSKRKSRRHEKGKHKSSRSSSKKRKKKSKSKKDDSPPPPPPPSSNMNQLGLPGQPMTSPQSSHTTDDTEEDASSTSDSGESDSLKNHPLGADDGNLPDASAVFKDKVDGSKKRKGKHGRFESKNQFIRRRPVSGVPMNVKQQLGITGDKTSSHLGLISAKRTEKTQATVQFLKECLLREVLFQGMDDGMINEIVDVMYRVDCPKGECIIRQNEFGDAYFVIESGAFDIIHQEMEKAPPKTVGEMLPGKAFGEGSLLYSIPRAATLKATKASIVWALDAAKFLEIRQKISQQVNDKTSKTVRFLKKIDLFKKYHHQDLVAIGQATSERKYSKNAYIVKQGEDATEFFLIKTGAAIATIRDKEGKEQTVKKYSDGDFFGERGIYKNEKRAASILATSTTRVFVIKAADFKRLLAEPLSKQFEEQIKKYDDVAFDNGIKRPFVNLIDCLLEEFQILGILGVGSFGRVSLVRDPKTKKTYSLKKVRKNKVIETGQQEHVRNERAVLATLDSEFCCRLYGTYQDTLNIYFLMEPVLGGELFTVLRWNKRFSEKTARFYAACVVLAFEHLHFKNIIYRDLKPENLLISSNGYCKLVDFGFAKKRNNSCTLCGTPEYLSPEVIQNYSQGFAVDWWALGIFIYESVVGHAPFQDDPNVKMYEKILTYEVDFPGDPKLTPRVEHLICGLLEKNAFQRLGSGTAGTQQILDHPWFHGLNWDEMRQQKIAPPYVPNIAGQDDLSHYDVYPEENIVEELDPDDGVYEWCEDF
eukprot:CAMPEP_0197031174 /NCGR_PEP_ID=MMETSP1384-20130603/10257_1 /TAXON_ID=29189 /ORGANISM="Ammonia sp." /LENGTH=1169 /DNA_ID=CAMNT_0042460665 /DNA_START=118 /DNA_END=3627 /DNA_ORIENTATION=+